jgi:uncharacterized metal-binding protein YceD (DUF177 family)
MLKHNTFIIPFSGLKIGQHTFEVKLTKAFFDSLDFFGVTEGMGQVEIVLDKKETMLLVYFNLQAKVTAPCDRCNEFFAFLVEGELDIIYKFGDESSDDENLIVLSPDSYQLDVYQPMYELMVTSLPSRILHEEENCDPEIIKWLEAKTNQSENLENKDIIDPRWSGLKNLK